MQIRKNTKAFKTILEIIKSCQSRPDREKLIRLYITRAGHNIKERISIEGIEGDAAVFYEMNYQAVLTYLQSANHQLYLSDDFPGIYFFRSTSNKVWDEMPFEFDEAVKKEFSSLADLPLVKKKEKVQKFVLSAPKSKSTAKTKKEKVQPVKPRKIKEEEEEEEEDDDQPNYKLKHKVIFTALDRIIFRQPRVNKKEVLDYYSKVDQFLLPYLKDRPLWVRGYSKEVKELTADGAFQERPGNIPDWVRSATLSRNKVRKELLLCNDRDHLLYYVEAGCIQFDPGTLRTKTPDSPDYIVIAIDCESEFSKTIDVILAAREILTGLQLPSFVKTDGKSGLHIYIPLDSKSKFTSCEEVAKYVCRLVRVKVPDLVTSEGSEEDVYGKVSLVYSLNEGTRGIVAPYSLASGDSPIVATPLHWEEIKEDLSIEEFNHETIFKRLKAVGDPFDGFFKKKLNADELLKRLEQNYSFLF